MALDDEDMTTSGADAEGPADSGAAGGTPGVHDGGADGGADSGAEGPADSGAGSGTPGVDDGGADSGAAEGPADSGAGQRHPGRARRRRGRGRGQRCQLRSPVLGPALAQPRAQGFLRTPGDPGGPRRAARMPGRWPGASAIRTRSPRSTGAGRRC